MKAQPPSNLRNFALPTKKEILERQMDDLSDAMHHLDNALKVLIAIDKQFMPQWGQDARLLSITNLVEQRDYLHVQHQFCLRVVQEWQRRNDPKDN